MLRNQLSEGVEVRAEGTGEAFVGGGGGGGPSSPHMCGSDRRGRPRAHRCRRTASAAAAAVPVPAAGFCPAIVLGAVVRAGGWGPGRSAVRTGV